MPEPQVTPLYGYHGTNQANVESIFANNFWLSDGSTHWLGPGVYFYGEGISDPVEDAFDWALKTSYDRGSRKYAFTQMAVIRTTIRHAKLLDATIDEGKRKLNYARTFLVKSGEEFRGYSDDEILKLLISEMKFDVVMVDLNIQTPEEISKKFNSRFTNVRVIVVKTVNVLDPATFVVIDERTIETHDI